MGSAAQRRLSLRAPTGDGWEATQCELLKWVAVANGAPGCVWTTRVVMRHVTEHALLDSGPRKSFIAPSLIEEARLAPKELLTGIKIRSATGDDFEQKHIAESVGFTVGTDSSRKDFLVAQIAGGFRCRPVSTTRHRGKGVGGRIGTFWSKGPKLSICPA